MCGRFALAATGEEVAIQYELPIVPFIVPRYNIAPTQPVAAVRLNGRGERELTHFQWGLIPSWAKDPSMGAKLINARSETAAEKPSFRAAFKRRRCLLPATGFYEWRKLNGGKQPMYIHAADGGLMSLAGLWEVWHAPDGGELETCTILTTAANGLMAPIHDRMPVIIDPLDYTMWLDEKTPADQLGHLLRPSDDDRLATYAVSTAVNSPKNDSIELIDPI
ncbi:MAG: SOS response-associated peptidase [Candidatus Promineofilum sp.]|nr:SOS response-associated peptidase [Promineifilum sp.]